MKKTVHIILFVLILLIFKTHTLISQHGGYTGHSDSILSLLSDYKHNEALLFAKQKFNEYEKEGIKDSIYDCMLWMSYIHSLIKKYEDTINYTSPRQMVIEEVYYKVIKVDTCWNDSCIAVIDGGYYDGIRKNSSGKAFATDISNNDSQRKGNSLGKGRILKIENHISWVKLWLIDAENELNQIRAGDLFVIPSVLSYPQQESILADLAKKNISIVNSQKEQIYTLRQVFSDDFRHLEPHIIRYLKKELNYISNEIVKPNAESTPAFTKPVEWGIYKGLSILNFMSNVKEREIYSFLYYMNEFPLNYQGGQWNFGEVFATWAINNAPMGQKSLMQYVMALPEQEQQIALQNYEPSIVNDGYYIKWKDHFLSLLLQDRPNEAKNVLQLMNKTAEVFHDSLFYAWHLFASAKLSVYNKDFKQSLKYYKQAQELFSALNQETEQVLCQTNIESGNSAQTAKVVFQKGHTLRFVIDFSPDSRYFASASLDNSIKIWDVLLRKEIQSFRGHPEMINSIRYSKDGLFLVSASDDKTIKIWSATTGRLINTIQTGTYNRFALFSPDARQVVSAGEDNNIYFWDTFSGKKDLELKGHKSTVNHLAYMPNTEYIASVSDDSMAYVWHINENRIAQSYYGKSQLRDICISKNNSNYLFATGSDSSMRVWDYTSLQFINKLPIAASKSGLVITPSIPSLSNDSRFLAVSTKDYAFRVYDLVKDNSTIYDTPHNMFINQMAFSPDGNFLASISYDMSICIYDFNNWLNTNRKTFRYNTITSYSEEMTPTQVVFSPDGTQLIIKSDLLRAWNLTNGKETIISSQIDPYNPYKLRFSGKTLELLYLNDSSSLMGYDFSVSSSREIFKGTQKIMAFDQSPANQTFVVAYADNSIHIVDKIGQTIDNTINLPKGPEKENISAARFSKDGQFCFVPGKNAAIYIIDTSTGNIINTFEHDYGFVYHIDLDTEGNFMASCGEENAIYIWDLKKMNLRKKIAPMPYTVLSANFSKDGKYLLTGGLDYEVKKIDWRNEKTIAYHAEHEWIIETTAWHPGNRLAASAGLDKNVIIWDFNLNKKILQYFPVKGGGFVAITPGNYYMAPKKSTKSIIFSYNHDAFPFEQFDVKYNRPDIVLKEIGLADTTVMNAFHAAWVKRLNKMKFSPEALSNDFHIPSIKILNENSFTGIVYSDTLLLQLKAEDSKYELDRINIWVNDVPVFGRNGYSIKHLGNKTFYKTFAIELSSGNNKIQVSSMNCNAVESTKATLNIDCRAKKGGDDLYLVTIGASKYIDSSFNLTYADKDARDISSLFQKQQKYFDTIKTYQLFNADVTKDNVLQLKKELLQSNVDDAIILFYAGHGLLDENLDYYFATYDVDFSNPSQKGIAYDLLESIIDSVPARKKLILLDACHSGEVDKEEIVIAENMQEEVDEGIQFRGFANINQRKTNAIGLKNSFELMKELFADLRRGSGAVVIASAGGGEFSYEAGNWGNGVFTYSLIHGIESKLDGKKINNVMKVSELQKYISQKVKELTLNKQNPTSRQENLEFDFTVYLYN